MLGPGRLEHALLDARRVEAAVREPVERKAIELLVGERSGERAARGGIGNELGRGGARDPEADAESRDAEPMSNGPADPMHLIDQRRDALARQDVVTVAE